MGRETGERERVREEARACDIVSSIYMMVREWEMCQEAAEIRIEMQVLWDLEGQIGSDSGREGTRSRVEQIVQTMT